MGRATVNLFNAFLARLEKRYLKRISEQWKSRSASEAVRPDQEFAILPLFSAESTCNRSVSGVRLVQHARMLIWAFALRTSPKIFPKSRLNY